MPLAPVPPPCHEAPVTRPGEVLWFEGQWLVPGDPHARIGLDDPGYMLGDGVFATMRAYRGRIFRRDAHLSDLAHGMQLLELGPLDDTLAALSEEAAKRTGAEEAYVRITVTRGPVISILSRKQETVADDAYTQGIATVVLDTKSIPFLDPRVKSTSYAAKVVARREVARRGIVEGVLANARGEVVGGSMANVFTVQGRTVKTPPLSTGARDGVTRRAAMEYAKRLGYDVREENVDLASAEQAFFTSTRVEVLPVAELDGRKVAGIELATRLRALLREEAFP